MTPLPTKEVPVAPTLLTCNCGGHITLAEDDAPQFYFTCNKCPVKFNIYATGGLDEAMIHMSRIAAAPTASEKAEPVAWVSKSCVGWFGVGNGVAQFSYVQRDNYPVPLFTLPPSAEQALRMAADICTKNTEGFAALLPDTNDEEIKRAANTAVKVLNSTATEILSLTNKQDTSAEQGEADSWVAENAAWPSEDWDESDSGVFTVGIHIPTHGNIIECHGNTLEEATELRDRVFAALSTSPPSADAMFNAGIEAAKKIAVQMGCAGRTIIEVEREIEKLKRPTDMVVMSREEAATLKAVAEEYNEWILFHDAGNGDYKDFVSRVKEGE
jgi:hypothetical protein